MLRVRTMVLCVVLATALLGCSKPGPTVPSLAPVKGTVTLDGKAMGGGEVRFSVPGQPVKALEIKDGAFTGEVFVGNNNIEVVWEKDGPPHPMNPMERLKINMVSPKFLGPSSPLNKAIEAAGASDLKFAVTSK